MPAKKKKKSAVASKGVSKTKKSVDIQGLAHAGTKESIETLKGMLEQAEGQDRTFVELALAESTYFYTIPQNEIEEQDWILATLIHKRERVEVDLMIDIDEVKDELDILEVEYKVAEVLHKNAKGKDKEHLHVDLEMAKELVTEKRSELESLEEQQTDVERWIEAARGLIKTEKYQSLPEECFSFFHDDSDMEGEDMWDEDHDMNCPHCVEEEEGEEMDEVY